MLIVERKNGQLHFHDDEREGFFTATIHQPEGSDTFEVNIRARGKRRKSRSSFDCRYLAPTLYAAGQIVNSEYHIVDASVDSEDSTLVADYWLDQLDGGLRWRIQAEDIDEEEEEDDDEEDDDDDDDGDVGTEVVRMIDRMTRG